MYAERVYSELPEVNWDSSGFDASSGAGMLLCTTTSRLALTLTVRIRVPFLGGKVAIA
jgi:hypothetical protein